MLPTRALTHSHGVPWMEPQNDVVLEDGSLPSFKSMLDGDWYIDQSQHHDLLQNDAFLMQHLDSSPPQQHFVVSPPKPCFSPFFNVNGNNPFDTGFDLGEESAFLPPFPVGFSGSALELSSNPEFPASQLGAGLAREEAFGALVSGKAKALRPLDALPPPTLFRKRAERRREAGKLEELVLPRTPRTARTELERRRKREEEDEGGLNYESDEVGKLEDNGFDVNNDDNGNGVSGGDQKGKKKGMPAKNLMAERRRRKKLNDRLYMLRSVVPKISKMDRASILGDAIDYLKELLHRINDLHNELESSPPGSSLPPSASFQPVTPTLPTLPCRVKEELCPISLPSPKTQSAKVEVRVREGRAVNIHMFCARRPGLLLSTMRALDNLGLDVQQAVISCFNGFALDVFRAEQCREGQDVLPEQIKAVLLDTAGFHGMM